MGLLDDAIREHLELKRRHGADPDEVARQENEALGETRRAEFARPEGAPESDDRAWRDDAPGPDVRAVRNAAPEDVARPEPEEVAEAPPTAEHEVEVEDAPA